LGKLARGIQIIALGYNVLMIEENAKIQNVNFWKSR
jgi:hypothetical protein